MHPLLVRLWKREELLAELVPAIGARGYDAGPVKAVLDG